MKLWHDTETRSPVPIKHGVAKYATGVEVIVVQFAIDDGPVYVVDMTDLTGINRVLLDIYLDAVRAADEIWAHGAEFDRAVLEHEEWWPEIPLERWRCTMALARMHGLPGGLDKLSAIFKLGEDSKLAGGKELIQLFCVPKKDGTYNDRHSHPAQWAEFLRYAGQDVTAMRVVHRKCPKWNATPRLWSVWHLDQKINQRGVAVDLKLCEGAVAATTKAKARLAARTAKLTTDPLLSDEPAVQSTTQRVRLLNYMAEYGVDLPDLTADTVERRLEDESLPEHIKELLRIRQQASKASTAKYKRVLTQAIDGRLHNLLVFCGAMRTGRWAGRTIQPQNLPRPKHKRWEIEDATAMFQAGAVELLEPDDVLGLASSCLRGMFIAGPGKKLVAADLANIEGRDMAWIAGEQWKLDAYAAYDRREGPDLYKVAYARAFDIDPSEVGDESAERQIGKVMELALQYYGSVGAFCSMAETYGLDLNELADSAWPVIPEHMKEAAREAYAKAKRRPHRLYGLAENVWLACMALVLMWRAAHPAIVRFWHKLEDAVQNVIRAPGLKVKVGRVLIDREGNWLRVRLPSGRYLSYPAPRIDMEGGKTSFVGVDPYTKQWRRISTYSGKLAENIVQGNSADILMDGMLAAEAAGYWLVMDVHDEIWSEPPDDPAFDDKGLSAIMVSNSPWAIGLPLAAKGFTGQRYRK